MCVSLECGGSGPLFDGDTEPTPPNPPAVFGFTTTSPLSMAWGFLTTFRWRLELKQKTSGVDKSSGTPTECPSSVFYGRDKNFFDPCRTWGSGTTHRKSTPALRRVQNSPPGTNTMGPAPPPGPICRTVEPDLMQSAHPCDITPLTP